MASTEHQQYQPSATPAPAPPTCVQQVFVGAGVRPVPAASPPQPQAQGQAEQKVFVAAGQQRVGKRPQVAACQVCGEKVQTRVEYNSCNVLNWAICVFTCFCCVFIPGCCDNGTNTATHYCPNCGALIGENSGL
ncbi:Lipopolysaccharide-induced tumor necrosis factor-alpha factor-like [Porphyridium purpureum]|uniref:Lipopolysaccharide-induced tumor necrosis factor-alpha factor-like n=1 Tax=Porphyridium purpureum TaxID=35688 RepID=A0A5J4YK98_PORPP|nr:Lipopolysaccharide-induced tumor necrosis factor-alpha factor-like [Porphyridium purpureum]|eukprot:POR5947..scf297_16